MLLQEEQIGDCVIYIYIYTNTHRHKLRDKERERVSTVIWNLRLGQNGIIHVVLPLEIGN